MSKISFVKVVNSSNSFLTSKMTLMLASILARASVFGGLRRRRGRRSGRRQLQKGSQRFHLLFESAVLLFLFLQLLSGLAFRSHLQFSEFGLARSNLVLVQFHRRFQWLRENFSLLVETN